DSSRAIALTSITTAEGEPARPARPLAIPQPRKAFLDKALAPLRHRVDRHPQPPRDLDVLLAIGGRQYDPGPHHLALLGIGLANPALQHPPLDSRQGDRKRARAAHQRVTTHTPPGV